MIGPFAQPVLLNVRWSVEVKLHDQRPIVTLLRFELVDLVERASQRGIVDSSEDTVVQHPAIPAAEEDRRRARFGKRAPKAGKPVAFRGLATVEADRMNGEVAGVECRAQVPKHVLLCRSRRSFQQDDRPAAVNDLRQLQLAHFAARSLQLGKHRVGR